MAELELKTTVRLSRRWLLDLRRRIIEAIGSTSKSLLGSLQSQVNSILVLSLDSVDFRFRED